MFILTKHRSVIFLLICVNCIALRFHILDYSTSAKYQGSNCPLPSVGDMSRSRSPGFPYDVRDPCNLQFLLSSSFTSEHLHLFQQHCDLVWYNRCMKSGSTTLTRTFSSKNATTPVCAGESPHHNHYMRPEDWEDRAQLLANSPNKPCIRFGHHVFIPFKKFSLPQPLIINLVRHPIPRTISEYFFIKYSMGESAERIMKISNSTYPGTLKTCALGKSSYAVCNVFFNYFCENETICKPRGADALSLAKRNIEEYGMIIGLTEELDSFLEVLEQLSPKLFGNLQSLYKETYETSQRISSNAKVHATHGLDTKDVKTLPYILDTEIQLYSFIKERFYKVRQKIFDLTKKVR